MSLRLVLPDGPIDCAPPPAAAGAPLTRVLEQLGHPLNTRCGGRGLCHGCEVQLARGGLRHASGPASALPGPDALRSCQWTLPADPGEAVELHVPARSLLRHQPAVVSEFRINVPWARDPLRTGVRYGAAVDVGTTTAVVALVDLDSGAVVADASAFNAQIQFGEDVLTRIQLCVGDPSAPARLQHAVAAGTIQPLLLRACRKARVAPREVGVMTVAGNTTMQHLLAGVNPAPMGTHPFHPVFLEHRVFAPAALGLEFGDPSAEVHLLPGPSAYVGADIAAGIVATGMLYEDGPVLLVDVGTNGEIVAKAGDRLVGCATAAGPAFEGAGLTGGVRAVHGAIERLDLRADPFAIECGIVGKASRPIGICGSAYVDFLWEARRAGLLLENGRFADALAAQAGEAVQADRFGRRLRIHPGAGRPVWISEVDIARLLQAKAAIAAGIEVLLATLGARASDVRRLHLAGGFGMHLSLEHAIGCGLLPGFVPEQIEVVGNSSLAGALLALNDRSLLSEAQRACAAIEVIELNLQPGFEDSYIDHLSLP